MAETSVYQIQESTAYYGGCAIKNKKISPPSNRSSIFLFLQLPLTLQIKLSDLLPYTVQSPTRCPTSATLSLEYSANSSITRVSSLTFPRQALSVHHTQKPYRNSPVRIAAFALNAIFFLHLSSCQYLRPKYANFAHKLMKLLNRVLIINQQ